MVPSSTRQFCGLTSHSLAAALTSIVRACAPAFRSFSHASRTLVLPPVMAILHAERGAIVCLIKPQFELSREDVSAGGIVRDPALHSRAVEKVRHFVSLQPGFCWRGVMESPIKGTDGNTEFLAWITRLSA